MSQMQAVGAASGDGAILDGVSSSIKATVFDLASSNPLVTAIVDASGAQITSFGGGTQYTEDAAAAANPVGTSVNLIRQDTPGALVTTDGDNVAQRGTNYGAGYVQVVTSAGAFVDTFGGGTQYTEDVAAAADPVGTALIMVRADSLAAVTTTDGDNIASRGTNKGELYVKHADTIAVTQSGTWTEANSAAIAASASVLDDWDESDRAKVNIIVGQAGIAGGTGVDGATVPRVSLATNVALPAGTNVIGHVIADTGSTTAVTGNVTVVQPTGTNLHTVVDSGAITETNSAAIAASLSVIDDWDETDRAKVNPIVGQAGVAGGTGVDGATVQRVTLATNVALPTGTNAIGKLAANSGVDIGDVDVTSIATGSNVIGRTGHDITGMGHGVKTVTSAGTDEALAGSTACKRVTIQAQTDNTSGVAVGAAGVDATVATGNGVYLNPGDAFELEIDNLSDVFIDALVSGEGVRYTYFT